MAGHTVELSLEIVDLEKSENTVSGQIGPSDHGMSTAKRVMVRTFPEEVISV